jgi:Domain of unknown function (DUF4078)
VGGVATVIQFDTLTVLIVRMSNEAEKDVKLNVSGESAFNLSGSLDLLKAQFEEQRKAGSKTVQAGAKKPLSSPWNAKNRGVEERVKNDRSIIESEGERSVRKLTEKAKIYEEIQRGAYDDEEGRNGGEGIGGLIIPDYQHNGGSDLSEDYSDYSESEELVPIEDSFGRTRMVPRGKRYLYEGGHSSGEEDDHKVERPAKILHGDVIQSSFRLDQTLADKVHTSEQFRDEKLAHYDSTWEIRDKGVGFFQFSQDVDVRKREMEELKQMRGETIAGSAERSGYDNAKELCEKRLLDRILAVKKQREKTLARLNKS